MELHNSKLRQDKFVWRGLDLHLKHRKRGRPILTLVAAAETFPLLYSIRYPDGWMSTTANLTRARNAAYGHARHLLGLE